MMTAFVTVRDYGADTRLHCPDCGLHQPYERVRDAQVAAAFHNANHHAEEQPA